MPTVHKVLSLPPERFMQLQEVAEAFGGITLAAAIGRMVRTMADQGLVPHHLPGVRINALSDGVALTLESAKPFGLAREGARSLVSVLREAADYDLKFRKLVNLDHDFTVSRVGVGILLEFGADGGQKLMPGDMAAELAELIEKAAEPTPQAA